MGNEAVEKVLEEHLFTVDRGIDDYSSFLGPEFRDSLAKLSSSGHWIDMGAGLGHAQIEYG
ncbi:MAG: hypothetical protein V4692_09065, partial [Bdellovibrionota bacterium]